MIRVSGALLALLAIAILLALFSFNANDVSFNTASTTGQIHNWMGRFGSHISDLLFQLIGLSSFFLCLILFSLGIKIASKIGIRFFAIKLVLVPFCILSFSTLFATLPEPDWWIFDSLGGVNGRFILSKISFIPNFFNFFLALILSFLLICVIIEISFSDWKYFCRYSYVVIKYLIGYLMILINKITDILIKEKNKILHKIDQEDRKKIRKEMPILSNKKAEEVVSSKTKQILKSIDNQIPLMRSNYKLPSVELLTDRSADNKNKKPSQVQLEQQSKLLIKVLGDFGVYGAGSGIKLGPVVTLHEFEPEAGTKSSRIISLADDIARSMSAISVRVALMPGKTTIGIELPNQKREMIYLRELIESDEYKYSQATLPIILGKDISGGGIIVDLEKMPHLLIAGTTGSGKSVGINAMILSLLYKLSPEECKLIMIDPKMLELSVYDGIPHLLSPVVTDPTKAVIALKWAVLEMEERYRLMSSLGVRNISGYNERVHKALKNKEKLNKKTQTGFDHNSGEPIFEEIELEAKKLPFIVVIVDEMADLMLVAGKEIEASVQRLAQMARAAGIHLIMATQRPSVDVITGVIKANFPTRISFQVTSRIDSRTILGTQGAEQLLGQGDMIYMSGGGKLTRVHGPFCSDTEVENVVNFIKAQAPMGAKGKTIIFEKIIVAGNDGASDDSVEGNRANEENDLYYKAIEIIKRDKKVSISYVQRQLRIGYNRAATLIEKMEEEGIISAPDISGKRKIIED